MPITATLAMVERLISYARLAGGGGRQLFFRSVFDEIKKLRKGAIAIHYWRPDIQARRGIWLQRDRQALGAT
jgi:hypothetical protein